MNYFLAGKGDEAIRAFEKVLQLTGRSPQFLAALGFAYGRTGRIGEAQKILEELQELAKKGYVPPYAFAVIYLALDEIDKGFDWLEKTLNESEDLSIWVYGTRYLDPFRSQPRWKALLHKMNLEL
jgi:tetratricopeptide (TPR) repeat protein